VLDVPDGQGEHAVETADAVRAILLVRVHQNFGIGSRAKGVAEGLQPSAQGLEVVDLAIESAPNRAVLILDRLITGLEIDDAEPADAERDKPVDVVAFAVGPR